MGRDCASGTRLAPLTRRTAGRCGGAGVLEERASTSSRRVRREAWCAGCEREGGGREKPSTCALVTHAQASGAGFRRALPEKRVGRRFLLEPSPGPQRPSPRPQDRPQTPKADPPATSMAENGERPPGALRRPELRAHSDPRIVLPKRG
jgi:hypothetical protein